MANGPAAATDVRNEFRNAGFEVVEVSASPETIEVRKGNCSRQIQRTPEGRWVPAGPPTFTVRGVTCVLEDRGYQKFWFHEGKRFPIRVQDLRTLHRFDQEVRAILGLKSLYHESLGTTNARTVYDRLDGRPDPLNP
jgi:hypothetical protein